MYYLLRDLEIISGKNFSLEKKPDKFFPVLESIPCQELVYKDNVNKNHFIYCNFKKGTGPIVLNKETKFILDLADGERTIEEIFGHMSQGSISLDIEETRRAIYFIKKGSLDIYDIYKKFILGRVLINQDKLLEVFNLFYVLGLVRFLGAPDCLSKAQAASYNGAYSLSIWIHLTGRCNLACDYCYVKKNVEEMTLEMGIRIIDKFIKTASLHNIKNLMIKFAGGEPFLALPLVLQLADRAIEKTKKTGVRLRLFILTNGTLVTEDAIDKLKKRNIRVSVSLDGIGKWHNRQAKFAGSEKGSFNDVKKGIDLLIKKNYSPALLSVISAINLDGFPELVRYTLDNKLKMITRFIRKTPGMDKKYFMSDQKLIDIMHKVYAIIEKNQSSSYEDVFSINNRFPKFNATARHECGVGQNYIVVEPDGSLLPCVMSLGRKEDIIGNINDSDDLLEIIKQPVVQQRNPFLEDREDCEECTYKYICTGDCPANAYYTYGSFMARSPYCEVYRAILPEEMRLIGKILVKNYRK